MLISLVFLNTSAMFVQCTKDNKGGRNGCYCALVKSVFENGRSVHKVQKTFGFVPNERIPYLKAAFNEGDPAEILKQELAKPEVVSTRK